MSYHGLVKNRKKSFLEGLIKLTRMKINQKTKTTKKTISPKMINQKTKKINKMMKTMKMKMKMMKIKKI